MQPLHFAAESTPLIPALIYVTVRERNAKETWQVSYFEAFKDGIRHIIDSPLIREALVVSATFAFVGRGALEIIPALMDRQFDVGAAGVATMMSFIGVGALSAGLTKVFLPRTPANQLPTLAYVSSLIGLVVVIIAGHSQFLFLSIGLATLLGFTAMFAAISFQIAVQEVLADGQRGRVMSIWVAVSIGSSAVGAAALGALVDWVGVPFSFTLAGAIGTVVVGHRYLGRRSG